jgi:hypothetical protein
MRELTGIAVTVEEADLFSLTGVDRDAAMSGLTTGSEFPFVIVDGVLVSCGVFDTDRIAHAIGKLMT